MKIGALTDAGDPQGLARDRFGVPIAKGDLVTYRPGMDLVFEVVDVKPVLDPRAPVGAVVVLLAVSVPLNTMANQPIAEILVVGDIVRDAAQPTDTGSGVEPSNPVEKQEVAPDKPALVLTDAG